VQKDQFWMKELSGLSLGVGIELGSKKIKGDLLFTHKGISGPAILNASLYWKKGQMKIDFLPQNKIIFNTNKKISNAFNIPKRFIKAFLDSINLPDLSLCDLTQDQKDKLQTLKSYSFAPAGNFGYTKAEVTRGGICTDEIDSQTMMSKKCENLYFLGECLDVTGELGGYNFQWAFSSAWRVEL
jgi:predicted Rossmann fold flavoprotein